MPSEFGQTSSDQQTKLSQEEDVEYKRKYRELKGTLKNVVCKNEYLKSELRHSQKKLQVFLQNNLKSILKVVQKILNT